MPSSKPAQPTDRQRAMASIEMVIEEHEAAAKDHELVGEVSRANGRRKLIAELRKRLAQIREGA